MLCVCKLHCLPETQANSHYSKRILIFDTVEGLKAEYLKKGSLERQDNQFSQIKQPRGQWWRRHTWQYQMKGRPFGQVLGLTFRTSIPV